jgi:hypothetical protein
MAMTPVRRQPPSSDAGSGKTLASVLHQNAQVEAKVEECAEGMSAIHAMLEGELSSLHPSNNRERALGQSKQVTERIAACAEDLHCVNVRWSQRKSGQLVRRSTYWKPRLNLPGSKRKETGTGISHSTIRSPVCLIQNLFYDRLHWPAANR